MNKTRELLGGTSLLPVLSWKTFWDVGPNIHCMFSAFDTDQGHGE